MKKQFLAAVATALIILASGLHHSAVAPAVPDALYPVGWNENRGTGPDGKQVSEFGSSWVNYYDGFHFQPITITPTQDEEGFHISAAPYALDMPLTASGGFRFTANNRYDPQTKQVHTDPPVGMWKRWLDVTDVPGTVSGSDVVYPHALPQFNADIVIHPKVTRIQNLVVFRSEPPGNGDVLLPFVETFDNGMVPIVGSGTLKTTDENIGSGMVIKQNSFRGFAMQQATVWDSARHQIPIRILAKMKNGQMLAEKIIPRAFLRRATYPVSTDSTVTINPNASGAGGATTNDGCFYDSGGAAGITWANNWSETTGTPQVENTAAGNGIEIAAGTTSGNWNVIVRCGAGFDTSSIGSSATISSVVVSLFGTIKSDTHSDAPTLNMMSFAPVSNTNYVTGDYLHCGTTNYATNVTFASWSLSGYNDFTWNSTGIAAINKTSVTNICIRESTYDSPNNPPTWVSGKDFYMEWDEADNGSNVPKMVVTYSLSSKPIQPLIMQLVKPLASAW